MDTRRTWGLRQRTKHEDGPTPKEKKVVERFQKWLEETRTKTDETTSEQ